MKILPYKRVKVSDRLYVKVSQHFCYTDFGVRDSKATAYSGRPYICLGTPGTGFFERDSESHSYHTFVRRIRHSQQESYLNMLLDREPNFDRELKRARAALAVEKDRTKREMLDCYVNALTVGRTEEYDERVVRGIKNKMGHHSNKFLVGVLSHYKNKISRLGHDMWSVEYRLKDHCTPEQHEAYLEMVDAFAKLATCRRVWCYDESKKQRRNQYVQVQFDCGIFDFIRSEHHLPIMRDAQGVNYYWLPDCILVGRSSLDFDLIPLRNLTVVAQELAIEEPVEMLSSELGDAASMIRIPEMGLTFYFNHLRPVLHFVHTVDRLKATIPNK